MHDGSIVIATPAQARRLVLLFHGLGSSADNFAPIGGSYDSPLARAIPSTLKRPVGIRCWPRPRPGATKVLFLAQ